MMAVAGDIVCTMARHPAHLCPPPFRAGRSRKSMLIFEETGPLLIEQDIIWWQLAASVGRKAGAAGGGGDGLHNTGRGGIDAASSIL